MFSRLAGTKGFSLCGTSVVEVMVAAKVDALRKLLRRCRCWLTVDALRGQCQDHRRQAASSQLEVMQHLRVLVHTLVRE